MNPLIQFRKVIAVVVALLLARFAVQLVPNAFGVVPPPDGGYPNFTTAEGTKALQNLTSGAGNTGVGWYSLFSVTAAGFNTGVGAGTLALNIAAENTAIGAGALLSNTTGYANTANGAAALIHNSTGFENAAFGTNALFDNIDGHDNVAVGVNSLVRNTSGIDNTACGASALNNTTTGNFNIALGRSAGENVTTADSVICIGTNVAGANVSQTTWIGNVYGVTTQSGTTAPVIVSDTGQLGTAASSERFKKDITTMDKASEVIMGLRPVTFHYKSDAKETPQFGLIAEEVAKVNPALVLSDKDGKPFTVRYDQVNAMLLNEFLKEHRKVEQQRRDFEAALAQQQKQIDALTAGLQKVSAQLELSKPAPQTAANDAR
jgi:trimeric autotransporter adhesin